MKVLQTDPTEYAESRQSESSPAVSAEVPGDASEEQIYSEEFAQESAPVEAAPTTTQPVAPEDCGEPEAMES